MRVAAISTDFSRMIDGSIVPGGCTYYRCYLPMKAAGVDGFLGDMAWDSGFGFGIKRGATATYGFDTVLLKLVMDRWTPRQIELAKSLGQRVIVDVDDFYDALPESNAAWEITHPDRNKVRNRDHYREVIRRADLVVTSTPALLEHHSKDHANVLMVRNGVDCGMFHVKPQAFRPVIGWVGSLAFRGNDVEILSEWLPDFLEEHDLMFHHSGGDPYSTVQFGDVVGIPNERMTYSAAVPMHAYPDLLTKFDIGLVPLNDIPFNHAKSNIKGLEYASAGIPFVATGLPEYRLLADDGVGRVADTPEDWVRHLTELLSVKVRKKEAAQQRMAVAERHSIYARAPEWREAFNSCR